jgi:hypothetical protein
MAKYNLNNLLTMAKYNINNQSQPGGVNNVMNNGLTVITDLFKLNGGEKHHNV